MDLRVLQVAPVALITHTPHEHYQGGIMAFSLTGTFFTRCCPPQEIREQALLCFQLTFTSPRFGDKKKKQQQQIARKG